MQALPVLVEYSRPNVYPKKSKFPSGKARPERPAPPAEHCAQLDMHIARQEGPLQRWASAISLPPQPLRLLLAGAVARWDLHPQESAAFARRTPIGVKGVS